jgi:hypothetical protein
VGDGKYYAAIGGVVLLLLVKLVFVLGIPVLVAFSLLKYLGWL